MKRLNVLAVMPWYPANAPRWFADCFEQMGHRVFRCGSTYFNHYNMAWPQNELPVIDHELPRNAPIWNLDALIDIATKRGFTPDLLFLSEENYQTHVFATKRIPTVLFSCDGWASNFARREMIKPTIAYTQHPFGVKPSPQERIPEGWKFLPGAMAPWIHRYTNWKSRKFSFTLYATMYGSREKICAGLAANGLMVSSGQRITADYVNGYNEGRFTYHNSQGQEEIKWRFFESIAMGCVNIADRNRLFSILGFVPYQHFIPIEDFEPEFDGDNWPSAEAIGRVIKAYENKPLEYANIATGGRWLVENDHTYQHRVRQILFDLGLSDDGHFIDYDKLLRIAYP